jgi:hypothetical protein
LHTYQKEQQGIKEVLERVSTLFADHPDLLKEFTFFLPDCVQEQAKERLHRAAAESEARQVAAAAAAFRQAKPQQPTGFKLKGQQRHDSSEPQFARRPISMQGSQKLIDMTMPHQVCYQYQSHLFSDYFFSSGCYRITVSHILISLTSCFRFLLDVFHRVGRRLNWAYVAKLVRDRRFRQHLPARESHPGMPELRDSFSIVRRKL